MSHRWLLALIFSVSFFSLHSKVISIDTSLLTPSENALLKNLELKAQERKQLNKNFGPKLLLPLFFDAIATNDIKKAEYVTNQWMKKNILILESCPTEYIINKPAQKELEAHLQKFLKIVKQTSCNAVYQYIIKRIESVTSDELKVLSGVDLQKERERAQRIPVRMFKVGSQNYAIPEHIVSE